MRFSVKCVTGHGSAAYFTFHTAGEYIEFMKESRISVFSTDNRESLPVYPQDVLHPTPKGEAEINGGDTRLTADMLGLLVLVDGKANVGDIEQRLKHIAPEALREHLRSLLRDGLVRQATVEEETGLDLTSFFTAADFKEPTEGAQASADREAESGGPALASDGYYVSIARRSVRARPLGAGEKHIVLLIDDDPDFCALIGRVLGLAGFEMRFAGTRERIVAELRKSPSPDLVLLDVILPGTNGFDILQRMKQVPALKTVPVIMTTAEATRAAVTRGLVGGADGYLTKPFVPEKLVKAARTVLGLT